MTDQHDDDEAPALVITTRDTNPWIGRKVGGGLDGPDVRFVPARQRPKGQPGRDAGR